MGTDLPEKRRALRDELGSLMARGVDEPLPDEAFNELALRVFRYQAEAVPVYGQFVRSRGIDPRELESWTDVPPVPVRGFQRLVFFDGDRDEAQARFLTSGTTGGGQTRGLHLVRDLSLYREALIPNARAHLNPESRHLRVLALLPSPDQHPESSLVHMVQQLKEEWDDGRGRFLAGADWSLDEEGLARSVQDAVDRDQPVLLVGTAFAFVHLLESPGLQGKLSLPAGSRVMETGGFKGRSRAVPRDVLYQELSGLLDLPLERIVNEYGMTEMLSQFYEPVLRDGGPPDPARRFLVGPPWVRTRILDPHRLDPVGPGEPGLLAHLDLANLHSVSALLTEDQGVAVPGGFRILGRTPGAEPRGCSLTMEELLAAGDSLATSRARSE